MKSSFWQPIELSLLIAISATLFVIILGIVTAWFMTKKEFPGKVIIEVILLLPIVLPPTVIGFLLIMLFGKNGVIGKALDFLFGQSLMFTVSGAILAAVVVAFPLMYQSVKNGFESMDPLIEDAARVDGANSWRLFRHISLPLCSPFLVTGTILSFARALGEFGATIMFAGNIPGQTQTLPLAIYVAFESNKLALAWSWVMMMVIISFVMLLFIQKRARRS
ncbi:molybdate ABC transporter permease subunit [Niallia circulans]|uniref:molybdate ABC transporter permease subunit n=1 Tax=Niallia TaxID=2837506 RepID=UPI000BA6D52A|nr:molybdate ABC transporter permease subunit [Niallia circulans]PAD25889.1 molybdate ABC transporter permease subunit [Niallia circulans]PAD88508.1 molybdate ABC transporter permease subunit [Niallia circulans]